MWETVAADVDTGIGDVIQFVALTTPGSGGEGSGLVLIDDLKVSCFYFALKYLYRILPSKHRL